jgi:phospholipid transport system substrate-binding protein
VTSRRKFIALAVSALALTAAPFTASAAPSAEGFVKSKHAELIALLKQNAPDAKVDKVFDQVLDYQALAQAALRDHWEARTPEERKEFTDLLSKLVRASYRKNLRKTLGYEIEYRGSVKGEAGEVVRTVARNKADAREEPVSIDYVVRAEGGAQRVIDIVTEGSSLVGNYRSSFNRIIKKSGFPEVLNKMRKKLEQGGGDVD